MGGRSGEEKLRKDRQAIVNDLKSQQASKQANAWIAPAELKKTALSHAKGDDRWPALSWD